MMQYSYWYSFSVLTREEKIMFFEGASTGDMAVAHPFVVMASFREKDTEGWDYTLVNFREISLAEYNLYQELNRKF